MPSKTVLGALALAFVVTPAAWAWTTGITGYQSNVPGRSSMPFNLFQGSTYNSHNSGLKLTEEVQAETFIACVNPHSTEPQAPMVLNQTNKFNGGTFQFYTGSETAHLLGGVGIRGATGRGFCVPRFQTDIQAERRHIDSYDNTCAGGQTCCQHTDVSSCVAQKYNSQDISKCKWIKDDVTESQTDPGCSDNGVAVTMVRIKVIDYVQVTDKTASTARADGGAWSDPQQDDDANTEVIYQFNDIDFSPPSNQFQPGKCSSLRSFDTLKSLTSPLANSERTHRLERPDIDHLKFKGETSAQTGKNDYGNQRQIADDADSRAWRKRQILEITDHGCLAPPKHRDETGCNNAHITANLASGNQVCHWKNDASGNPSCVRHANSTDEDYIALQQSLSTGVKNQYINQTCFHDWRQTINPVHQSTVACFKDGTTGSDEDAIRSPASAGDGAGTFAKEWPEIKLRNAAASPTTELQATTDPETGNNVKYGKLHVDGDDTYECKSDEELHHSVSCKGVREVGTSKFTDNVIHTKRERMTWFQTYSHLIQNGGAVSVDSHSRSKYFRRERQLITTLAELFGKGVVHVPGTVNSENQVTHSGYEMYDSTVAPEDSKIFGKRWHDEEGCVPPKMKNSDERNPEKQLYMGIRTRDYGSNTNNQDTTAFSMDFKIYLTSTVVRDSSDRMNNVQASNGESLPRNLVKRATSEFDVSLRVKQESQAYVHQIAKTTQGLTSIHLSDSSTRMRRSVLNVNKNTLTSDYAPVTPDGSYVPFTDPKSLHIGDLGEVKEIGTVDFYFDTVTLNAITMPYSLEKVAVQEVGATLSQTHAYSAGNQYYLQNDNSISTVATGSACAIVLARKYDDYYGTSSTDTVGDFIELYSDDIDSIGRNGDIDAASKAAYQVIYIKSTGGVSGGKHDTHTQSAPKPQAQVYVRHKVPLRMFVKSSCNMKDRTSSTIAGTHDILDSEFGNRYQGAMVNMLQAPIINGTGYVEAHLPSTNKNVTLADVQQWMTFVTNERSTETPEIPFNVNLPSTYSPMVLSTSGGISAAVPPAFATVQTRMSAALQIEEVKLYAVRPRTTGSSLTFPMLAGDNQRAFSDLTLKDFYGSNTSHELGLSVQRVDAGATSYMGAVSASDTLYFPTRIAPTNMEGYNAENYKNMVSGVLPKAQGKCSFDEKFLIACVINGREDNGGTVLAASGAINGGQNGANNNTAGTSGASAASYSVSNGCGYINSRTRGSVLLLHYEDLEAIRTVFPNWFKSDGTINENFVVDYSKFAHDNSVNSDQAHTHSLSNSVNTESRMDNVALNTYPYGYASDNTVKATATRTIKFTSTNTERTINVFSNEYVRQLQDNEYSSQQNDCEFGYVFRIPSILNDDMIDLSSTGASLDIVVQFETGVYVNVCTTGNCGDASRRSGELIHRRAMVRRAASDDDSTSMTNGQGAQTTYNPSMDIQLETCTADSVLKITMQGAEPQCIGGVSMQSGTAVRDEHNDTRDDVNQNTLLLSIMLGVAGVILMAVSTMVYMQYKTHRMTWELNTMLSGAPMVRGRSQARATPGTDAPPPTNPVVDQAVARGRFM